MGDFYCWYAVARVLWVVPIAIAIFWLVVNVGMLLLGCCWWLLGSG